METTRQWETAKGLMPSSCTISSLRGRRCTISTLRESHAISLHHILLCEACKRREHASGIARHASTCGQIIVCVHAVRVSDGAAEASPVVHSYLRAPPPTAGRARSSVRTGVASQSFPATGQCEERDITSFVNRKLFFSELKTHFANLILRSSAPPLGRALPAMMEAEASEPAAAGEGLAGTAEAEAEHAPDEAPSAEIAGAEVQHATGEVGDRSGTMKEMKNVGINKENSQNKSPPGRSTVASLRSIAGHQRVPKHLRGRTSLITPAGDDDKDREDEVDTRNLDMSLLEKIAACPDEECHSDEGDGEADGIAGRVHDEATAPDRHTGTAAVLDRRQEATDGLEGGGKDGEAAGKSAADFVYSGERDDDGLPHGFGRCVYSQTGLVYEGEFEHGGACGDGKLTWPNGSVYLGVVFAGQPVEGRLDRANGETLYFVDGEVQDSEWYALEDREVTQEELDAAKQEAEAARLDVLKARLIAEEMHASIELKEAQQEVENLAREVKRARTKVQRERRLRTTQAAMSGLRLRILCTKEEPVRPVSDTGEGGEEEAGRVTTDAARSASPSSRPQTRSTATQGGNGGADVAGEAEAEVHKLERKRAGIVMEISVDGKYFQRSSLYIDLNIQGY